MNILQFDLNPDNTTFLANLCGVLDENITAIARHFDVVIRRRGAHFELEGKSAKTLKNAQQALETFYESAEKPLDLNAIHLGLLSLNAPAATVRFSLKKKEIIGKSAQQVAYLEAITKHDIVFGVGPAGTGKTYLAVAAAVDALERHLVERIILTRPAVEAGERLGFLPGDLSQKVDPYLRPLLDALNEFLGAERLTALYEKNRIEIAPLAFMRGRTLSNAFVILDEAQNTTSEQMKMFLTRIGFGTKAIITGDLTQIDLPAQQLSGLKEAETILKNIPELAWIRFSKKDVMRHPLVAKILGAYEKKEKKNNENAKNLPAK